MSTTRMNSFFTPKFSYSALPYGRRMRHSAGKFHGTLVSDFVCRQYSGANSPCVTRQIARTSRWGTLGPPKPIVAAGTMVPAIWVYGLSSEAQFRQSRVIVGAAPEGPVKLAFGFLDRQIVDGSEPTLHEARSFDLPIFIAVRAKPVAAVIMPFISEANCDTVALEGPQLLYQAVVQFLVPLPC